MARFLPPPTLLLMMVFCQQTRSESCSDAALCSVLNDNLCAYSEVQQLCKTKCKTCGGKDLHCPDITISHGDTMTAASPPHKVGAVANFVCDTGFKRTGVQNVACMKSGKWSDQPPTCTAISCERNRDKLEKGRTCQAKCKRGDFCGNKFHTCQCDDWCGKSCFNATNIQCKLLSSPQNGFIKSKGRRYGQSADYSCKPGYVLIGPSTRRCRSDRKWSGSNPFCVPMGACGFTMKQEEKAHKVVHGNDAKKGDWPWQALIFDSDQQSVNQVYRKSVFGGGSLIDEGWVLSAAHVFEDQYPSNVITKAWKNTFILAFGMTAYVKRGHAIPEHVQIFEPADVFMHPKFDPKSLDYDVALVRIGRKLKRGNNEKFVTDESAPSGKVTFSQYVRPVCLPCMKGGVLTKADVWRKFDKTGCVQKEKSIFPSFAATGSPLTVTGFGLTNLATKEQAGNLQDGVLEVVDPMTCGKDIPAIKFRVTHARYTSRMFCASGGNESRRIDSCKGDSGGPAVKEVTRTRGSYRITYWVQVGIVSWGLGCAERYHGYYTSVPSVMQWVWETLDDSKNAAWGDWSQWGVCDVTCGSGNMKRTRICAGTAECRGSPSETIPCNIQQCSGVWKRWGSWTSCSVSCGGGKMSRSRVCAGPGDCAGNANDEKKCKTESCPGVWKRWGSWTSCSVSCGGGKMSRSRVCAGPGDCAGNANDEKKCKTESCPVLPKRCNNVELKSAKSRDDKGGVFNIDVPQVGATEVYCDLTTDGGGWTVFHRRTKAHVGIGFNRDWEAYAHGFGNASGEFWLGLETVYQLTKTGQYELRIDLILQGNVHYYAEYSTFKIGPSTDFYRLSLSGYSGNATDAMTDPPASRMPATSNGQLFSTSDPQRNIQWQCAERDGAWWHNHRCSYAQLNSHPVGWYHHDGKGWLSVRFSEMKFRPRQ